MNTRSTTLAISSLFTLVMNVGCEADSLIKQDLSSYTESAKQPAALKTLSCSAQELNRFDYEPSFRNNGGTQEPMVIKQDKDGTVYVAGLVLSASAPTTEGWLVRRMDKKGHWTTVDSFSQFDIMDQYSTPMDITIANGQVRVIGQKTWWDRTARVYRIAHHIRESLDQGNTWRTLAESEYPVDLQYDYPLSTLDGSTDSPAKKIADGSLVRVVGPKTFDHLLWNPGIGETRIERTIDRVNWTVVARVENSHDDLKRGIYREVSYVDNRDGSLTIRTSEEVSTTGYYSAPDRKTLYVNFTVSKFSLATETMTVIEQGQLEDPYKMRIETHGLPGVGSAGSVVINDREIQFRYLDTKKNITGRIRSEDGQSWIGLSAIHGTIFRDRLDWLSRERMIPLSEVTLPDGRGVSIGTIQTNGKPAWVIKAHKCNLK